MVVAGVIALVALVVVVASLGYLHVAPTGLSPVRNAVSQYGITAYRLGYRVATIAFGVAGVALAVGIGRAVHGVSTVVVLLVVFALARLSIGWFPMDLPGTERTASGARHGLLAIVAFVAVAAAATDLGRRLSVTNTWHHLAAVSNAFGIAMIVALVTMALARSAPAVRARFGAVERVFYLLAIGWFAVFSVACAANVR